MDALEFLGQDKGFKATGRCQGKTSTWDVERVIANVGYTPDTGIYRELQVHEGFDDLGGTVVRSVDDDDHLVVRVLESLKRVEALADGRRAVVGAVGPLNHPAAPRH